jgi:hypothetical protein
MGVFELSSWRFAEATRVLRDYFRDGSLTERCALILAIVTVIGLFAAALGPAVDADSLNYHLGVPLDWLRHGGAYPAPDWMTARYVGLGESMNMLGLAAGTDGLGAAFQAAGLVVASIAVTAFATDRANRLFAVLLILGCPVMFLLVTGQKPMLFPTAALALALVIIVHRFNSFDIRSAILAFGCVTFAMANKHSYLLTGSVVVFVGLIAAFRAQRLRFALLVLAGCFAMLAAPVFARNFVFYGDPISPLLERWLPGGDPGVIAFAQQALRDYSPDGPASLTIGRLLRLPWDLAITLSPGALHHVLGLGVFAFPFALRERGPRRKLLLGAMAGFILVIVLSQPNPRFFLESYIWGAAAAAAAPWGALKSLFFKALMVQAAVVSGVGIYLGSILLPGALTQAGRDHVMTKMALGYAEAKWLDATLPADAVVVTEGHSHALMPRPFVVVERFLWKPQTNDTREQLAALLKEKGVTVLVTGYPPDKLKAYSWLADRYGTPLAGPAEFRFAARSPFNRGDLIRSIAVRLDVDGPGSHSK